MPWYVTLILCFFGILLGALFLIGWAIARSMYHPSRLSLSQTRDKEKERTPDLLALFDTWDRTGYVISSRYGYPLQCYFFPSPEKKRDHSAPLVIISHGYTYSHYGGIKYAFLMRQYGYDVVMYDQRYHADSGGKTCSLGFYESRDLETVIDDAVHRFGIDRVGLYGESMGAVSALLEQAGDSRIRFVVADCPFADLRWLVTGLIRRRYGLLEFPFVPLADAFFRCANGIPFSAIRPIEAVRKAKCPILFIHGSDDAFVPPEHSQRLFEACPSPKMLFLAENGARHAEAFRKNRQAYAEVLNRFLTEHGLT
jgi:hypothetical protein